MSSTPAPVTAVARRARLAVSAVFLVNGVAFANLVPRYPEVKDRLDLSNSGLGTAIAAFPTGALLAGLFAAAIIGRFGSARVASFGLVTLTVAMLGVGLAPSWVALAAVMLVAGGIDAVVDVAQNAHGFRVQRLYRRSIVNAFHGLWSVGAVAGGLLGSAAAGLEVPLTLHLGVVAIVFSAVALVAYRFLLSGPDDAERARPGPELDPADVAAVAPGTSRALRGVSTATVRLLAALGILAACGAFVEDAGASWGALYLRDELGATAALGGGAFVALQLAMTTGRLTGDRVVDRFGQRRVALAGGALIAGGMGFALAVPTIATTLAGFALAGLGVATLIPAVMHTADEIEGLPDGVGLTIISWLLRAGFLISPPLVGLVADAISLRVALLSVVVAGLGILAFGRVLVATPAEDTSLTDASLTDVGDPLRP
jgi:MFS family permease